MAFPGKLGWLIQVTSTAFFKGNLIEVNIFLPASRLEHLGQWFAL
jgi:hypothetical protein